MAPNNLQIDSPRHILNLQSLTPFLVRLSHAVGDCLRAAPSLGWSMGHIYLYIKNRVYIGIILCIYRDYTRGYIIHWDSIRVIVAPWPQAALGALYRNPGMHATLQEFSAARPRPRPCHSLSPRRKAVFARCCQQCSPELGLLKAFD